MPIPSWLYMNLKFFLEDLFEKKIDLVVTKSSLKLQIINTVLAEAIDL